MRINQSPNWRALAVLGALLSVIIVWPTVLSMPMFSKSPSSTTTSSGTTEQQPLPPFVAALSNLTLNVTTVAPPNGDIVQNDSFYSVRQQIANYSDYSDYGSLLQLNVSTSDSEDDDGDQDIDVDEHLTHDRGDIDPLYAIMEPLDDSNESKSRRVKKSNMVYNKRKRKKTNGNDQVSAEDDVSNTTYLSSASISDDNNYIPNSLSHNNKNSSSVSVSDVDSSDQVTAASIVSHRYPSKRTRNSINSDTSEPNYDVDDDDIDVMSTKIITTTITTMPSPSRGSRHYFSTTPADDADVTSEFSNVDETSDHDNSDMYVTSSPTTIITSSSSAALIRPTTPTHTDYPVLSRTDRSVHKKRDIPDRQQGSSSSSNNGGTTSAAEGEGEGGSIKSRRLKIHNKNHNYRNNNHTNSNSSNLDRNERSTISHISGPGRKIQLYIKNRFIQLMPDGTVNGTQDDLSDYTILQRTTVDVGRIKIQGVATCLYLCMDQCGAVYGSKEFTDDCVFNESMEQHNYNTYSSTYNSNSRRIYYLALNRHGEPRKLQIPPSRSLGKLATYTKAITETVPQIRVEKLIAKKFGANRVKHGIRQLCDTGKPLVELTDNILKARSQCTATNSNSNNSNSSNSNKNGQLNVPAANDKSRLSNSNSNLTNSTSSSSISAISSSISNSSSNGHTSSNSNNNHVIKKKKKKRRCRPGENEDEHNCQRGGPQAMKKRPANHNKMARCKDAAPDSMTAVECANPKRPKKGGKKGGPKHNGAKQNGGGPPGGDGRRGGKKLNQNGRQQQGGNNNKNSNKKNNGKQPKNGLGGGGRTTTTTVHPMVNNKMARTRTAPSTTSTTTTTTTTTTTVAPPAETTTTTTTTTTTETSAANSQQTLVSSSQVISGLNQTSGETAPDTDESVGEDTSAEVETGEAESEDDDTGNDDDDTSSHLPFIGENTRLFSGTDDFLYDDDLDL